VILPAPPHASRIEAALRSARSSGRRGFIPFLTAGFPDRDTFLAAAERLARAGADAIEVGVPFSDPIADGPTIQRASERALATGVTMESVLEMAAALRARSGIPLVLMTYVNPVLAFGAERFARRAREAGADGVLVSDLPPEEGEELFASLRAEGLDTILLVAPTTTAERVPLIARECRGFLYVLARTGVTGAGAGLSERLAAQLSRARAATALPLAVGFGVRSGADVAALPPEADAVIVGAALLERLAEDPRGFGPLDALAAEIRDALPDGGNDR
jgi:tryptophan synthase alpha chain